MTYRITVFDIDGNIKTVRKFTDEKEWSIAFSEYGQCGKYRRSWRGHDAFVTRVCE